MSYLDTEKSVIISSPAGSGKTEKLARRYIALLKAGVDAERILAITFTDKAAAEMKQRILKILKDEEEELFENIIQKMSLMRVSTIHSFCGTLLRRFSFEASLDPNYRIENAVDSRISWEEVLFDIIMAAGKGKEGYELLLQEIAEKGFRGLDRLKDTIDYLFKKTPFSLEAETVTPAFPVNAPSLTEELRRWPGAGDAIEDYEGLFRDGYTERLALFERSFLTDKKEPRRRALKTLKGIVNYQDWSLKMYMYWKNTRTMEKQKKAERIRHVFLKCADKYAARKKANGLLDFSDLEYIAYRMLTGNHEWANILYAFDEKTDHILVDEFQDTNSFQWGIIDMLTEEWRSGLGAKRDAGEKPTLFLVGDEKQSIYFFRGANVEIFHRAKEKLADWLGDEFYNLQIIFFQE
jgi:ATP-dependent helicase/nuclease subunit A